MDVRLVGAGGETQGALDRPAIEERLASGECFWLDVHGPAAADVELLGELFAFHPLALEDTAHFGQRPKLDDYDDHSFLVLYGFAPDDDGLVEVHCYCTERFLVTVRRDRSPGLDALRDRYERGQLPAHGVLLLHHVADALVDSFFPALSVFDDRLDLIQTDMFRRPKDEHLEDIFTMKQRIHRLRRILGPQRDLAGRLASGNAEVPGMSEEARRYFRDVYDHLIRLTEELDGYRDVMTSSIDVYLSAASNRMNTVMKQLTVIATIFLPLTFVTGFFGQNFPWMVEHIGGGWWFLGLGLGAQLLTVLALLAYFKRRGWS